MKALVIRWIRRFLMMVGALTLVVFVAIMRESIAMGTPGSEDLSLAGILAQAKILVQQAKDLKKEYYDKHIKVAVDTAKDVNDFATTAKDTYDTLNREKEALTRGIGSVQELGKLQVNDYDRKLAILTRMIESLEYFNEQYSKLDKDYAKVAAYVSPEKKEELTQRKRVYAVLSESRTQSVSSEAKIDEIRVRESASVKKLDASGSSPIDKVHGTNAIVLTSINDKFDEMIRLQAKTNDLLEAMLQFQTMKNVNSRYGEKVRNEKYAAERVDAMSKGEWGGARKSSVEKGK